MSFVTKIFIASVLFCFAAIGIGAYLFLNGANLISANNIDVTINGPISVDGGTPISFDVVATNNNNVPLQTVDMSVDFPAGTTDPTDPTSVLQNYRKLIGDMPTGGVSHQTVNAIMFGEENTQKEITVTLTYSVKGSTAIFTKVKTYDVLISSSPLSVNVSSFDQITSGQQFDLKVVLKSNSSQILKNVLVKATYPFGFTYSSASVKPLSDNQTWKIGDLPPGASKTITITGKLDGQDTDTRVFHFYVGAQSTNDPKTIGTQYGLADKSMTIQKPFISLNVGVDNDQTNGDYVGKFGQSNQVQITWFNNLSTAVSNVQIVAKLSGTAYDKTRILPSSGNFQSATDQIVWNQQTNPELASIAPGGSGSVSFSVTPVDRSTLNNQIINPVFNITAGVSGDRKSETNVPQNLTSVTSRNIRIASNATFTGRIVRSQGPFANIGPIPPKAEKSSTYTVVWIVDNTSSAVGKAQVTATLPSYVTWLGNYSPTSENVTYDKNSGTITWAIGNVDTYTVNTSHRRELDFQISLNPSIAQVGQLVNLVNQANFMAVDTFTNSSIQGTQDTLTTRYSTDPVYKPGDETVIR